MAINFFNSEKILRLTPLAKDTETVANAMLTGDVRIFPKLPNVRVGALEELWEMKFDSAPSTYALYVYALYPVSYLLNAYEATGRDDYLKKALSLVMSFLDWELKSEKGINKKRLDILFGDHAVSNRTQVLCYLICCLTEAGRETNSDIRGALLRNGEYLADIENYSHYNHGLMMDLALLGLINTLEGSKIDYPDYVRVNLLKRLQHSLTRDLTEDGVHVENSPGYHFWMLGFLGRITSALEAFDSQLYFKVQKILEKATEYAEYITRLDGTVPAIGDTHAGVKFKPNKFLETKFFEHANQVIFRSSKYDIWAHFVCGYKTHVHKHSDNGAFNLHCMGKDVFIDPGFLSYENDEDSLRIKGCSFHNVVRPKGEVQEINIADLSETNRIYSKNLSSSSISEFQKLGEIELATATISEYKAGVIKRTIVWLKPYFFLIFDRLEVATDLEQIFHISPMLKVVPSKSCISILDVDDNFVCEILQFNESGERTTISDNFEIKESFYAEKFNLKRTSERVVFKCGHGFFTTLINISGSQKDKFVFSINDFLENFNRGNENSALLSKLKSMNLIS